MYLGTLLCALICIIVVFQVAVTHNTSLEWVIWIFVILGFFLLGFGYIQTSELTLNQTNVNSYTLSLA
jgi:hypothetical protein